MSKRTDQVLRSLISASKACNLPLDIIARNNKYPFVLTPKEAIKIGTAVFKLTENTIFTAPRLIQDIYEQSGGTFVLEDIESSYEWCATVFEDRECFLAVFKVDKFHFKIGYPTGCAL